MYYNEDMTHERREFIKSKVKDILDEYNPDRISPFPFSKIEDDHSDLSIEFMNFRHEKIKGLSGVLYEDEGKFKIVINSEHASVRQYFTLAHEIGHFFLHKEYIEQKGMLIDDNTFGGKTAMFRDGVYSQEDREKEVEANFFAAELIMPEDYVRKYWPAFGEERIVDFAKIFNVSLLAITIRLETLNLLNK